MADEDNQDPSLNDRILDVFVYAPAGFILSALDDFPKLAALGRDRLGTQVSNARVLGEFAVKAGRQQLQKRGEGLLHRGPAAESAEDSPVGLHSVPTPPPSGAIDDDPTPGTTSGPVPPTAAPKSTMSSNGHVPTASSLAIPGFDTLSASQVVQRLDGLSRGELVSARAYEAGTRGRRTILSRIDQLLEERA
ncbi:MAG TPA: hypothetical protein VG412_07025 [Acidimicrobiales bacterium]|jgi:hypothetical protein|nr:hypothetical protein [Acidimicrobiales bacterium]